MTVPVSVPLQAYRHRAANGPRPANFRDDWSTIHDHRDAFAEFHAATGWIFWADISEYQTVVERLYPYPMLTYRLDTGYRLDKHAKANHRASAQLKILARVGYVVFIPNQSKAQLVRLKNTFGTDDPGIGVMVDMEGGSGFAGPGDHSSEANDLAAELAAWTHNRKRILGYANAPDWSHLWTVRVPWMKQILASYSSVINQRYWAQQYMGGTKYPTPPGFPTACKPFGSWVDMNARHTTVPALLDDLGLGDDLPMNQAEFNKLMDGWAGTKDGRFAHDVAGKKANTTIASYAANADDNSATLVGMVSALAKKLGVSRTELQQAVAETVSKHTEEDTR